MASLVVTNTFAPNTVIESAKMNTNFDDIETYINNRNSGAATWDVMNAVTGTITTLVVTNLSFLPAGTKMPFYQASPPTGWTAVAVNNKFMRVVNSGGTGGTTGGGATTPSSTLTLAHAHTVASHTHSTPNHVHPLETNSTSLLASGGSVAPFATSLDTDGSLIGSPPGAGSASTYRKLNNRTTSSGSDTSGAATPATDSQLTNATFAYADFCVGSKD